MPHLLLIGLPGVLFEKPLKQMFPDISIHAADTETAAGDFVKHAEIIHAFKVSDDLIQRASQLEWIHTPSTGVDKIVSLPSLAEKVIITSGHGSHGPQVADAAFLMMLALSRNLPEILRNQQNKLWRQWPAPGLENKHVGILGVGVIGKEIARRCKAFGMTVHGITRRKRAIEFVDYSYGVEDLIEAVPKIDFFIIAAPITPQTRRMVNAKVLAAMKPSSYLINLGRGAIVDEESLIRTLQENKIAGAALDTFATEPLPAGHPFWEMQNVIVTPHVSGMGDSAYKRGMEIFEENLRRFLEGERLNLINYIKRIPNKSG
ncbi:MAG: D-2-hydroxyacid dehydrogenase [Thermodesulfobacteriota bacterium]